MKKIKMAGITISLMIACAMTSYAQNWYQENENWKYEKADGSTARDEWIQDNGFWYYLKSDGFMAHQEWIQEADKSYYVDESGRWTEDSSGYEAEADAAEAERLREWAEYLELSAKSGEVEIE